MSRLTNLPTLRIRPGKPISFRYGKKLCEGVEGDTIATALYASGTRIFSRSLKYHRPRGLYGLEGECSNTFMRVDGVPNVPGEKTFLRPGMRVVPQVGPGGLRWDVLAFMDKMSWAMPAGFYYRMFHRPAALWPRVIPFIRRAAGKGVLDADFELPGRCDEIYVNSDICVIGGGPSGMAAALAAAEKGFRVILLEARPWLGGSWDHRISLREDGTPLFESAAQLARQVEESPLVRVFRHTAVAGVYPERVVAAFQTGGPSDSFRERYVEVRSESLVVATGCTERPLLFEHNERPGVMQAGCAHRLAHTWGILPGRRVVFSVGDDLGLEGALDLAELGVEMPCVADVRWSGQDAGLLARLREKKIPFFKGWTASRSMGRKTVKGGELKSTNGVHGRRFPCDVLVASAGQTPVTGPLAVAGARLVHDDRTNFFLPGSLPPGMHAAGRMLGYMAPEAMELSGRLAGLGAVLDFGGRTMDVVEEMRETEARLGRPPEGCQFVMAPVKGKKTFVCFDEDTTVRNVNQAMEMGLDVPELIKRWTAAGTGPGQGGIPGHNLPLLVSHSRASPDEDPRPTTTRPPLVPVLMGTYGGRNHDMCKRTPVHALQEAAGGHMERVGVWMRARRFGTEDHVRKEVANVRSNVGLLDSSTLGKFRLHGPDALKVLQRVYVSDLSTLREGRVRYSAMCTEDACVLDDGVVVKRGEEDYYFTTSSARSGATAEWIHYHARYENWDYDLVNLTDAFGVINLAGPRAREVLEKMTREDVSGSAFPFTGYRELLLGGEIPVRAMRLGFVGELSYELHVPSSLMQSLWEMLEEAGRPLGIQNFGLEAQNILRLEKGHVILGSESEQRTTLHDLGLGFLWSRKKNDGRMVGLPALQRTEHQEGRLKLVGFKMTDPAHQVPRDGSIIADRKIWGHVCTARYSDALGHPIGFALVKEPFCVMGARLPIYEDGCQGRLIHGQVIPTPFYDAGGERMKK